METNFMVTEAESIVRILRCRDRFERAKQISARLQPVMLVEIGTYGDNTHQPVPGSERVGKKGKWDSTRS